MDKKDLYRSMQEIDDDVLEESEKKRINKPWLKLAVIAACAALVITAAAVAVPLLAKAPEAPFVTEKETTEEEYTEPLIINKDRYDKNKTASVSEVEIEIEWPQEYLTPVEKAPVVTLDGIQYRTRASEIRKSLLEKSLGECEASGSGKKFEAWKIKNVDSSQLIAVDIEGTFVVFMNNDPATPATFKELYDAFGLSQTLKLDTYCEKKGYSTGDWFKPDAGQYVIDALADCGDAPLVSSDGAYFSGKSGITFTATSEALGIYKKSLIVTEDGYLCTNIAEYGYSFEIGAEKANEIISYVKAHSEKTEMEPFYNSVAGIITEIGDGYILVDDSVLCKDEKDGIVFKIPTDSMIVRRRIEYYHLKTGDAVMIEYKGNISKDYTVNGIVSMNEARIFEDGIYVEE